MTVREMIEHLAQFEPGDIVKLRDPRNPMVLSDVKPHAVSIEEFVDMGNISAAEARRQLTSGELKSIRVVAIG